MDEGKGQNQSPLGNDTRLGFACQLSIAWVAFLCVTGYYSFCRGDLSCEFETSLTALSLILKIWKVEDSEPNQWCIASIVQSGIFYKDRG